jgi:hypothetical protein
MFGWTLLRLRPSSLPVRRIWWSFPEPTFMWFLISQRISIFIMAGGGVSGTDDGIAPDIMISGWIYYDRVPVFYSQVFPYWRNYYHDHRWEGREWNYQRIPYEHLQRNWSGWERSKYWEYQQSWGVRGFQPHPLSANIPPPPPPANKPVNRDFRPPNELKPFAGPVPKDIKVQKKFEKEGEPVRLKPVYKDSPPLKAERREFKEAHVVKPPPKPDFHEVKGPPKHPVEHKQ